MKIDCNNHLFFLVLFVFSINCLVKAQKRYECNRRTYEYLDDLSAKLIGFGSSGRKLPVTQEEVPKFCNETKYYVSTFNDVNKRCLKGLPKQVMSIGLYSINVVMKKLCRKSSKRLNTLLDAAQCANDANNEFDKCFTKSIDNILGIQKAEHKDKIPMTCCQYNALKACGIAIAPKIASCSPKKVETLVDFVDSIAGNALNLVCGQYMESGTDVCDKLIIPKKRKSQKRTKSIFLPLIDLFESFPEV